MNIARMILAISRESDKSNHVAYKRIAQFLEEHSSTITVMAERTVQDVDHDEIHIGQKTLRLGIIEIPVDQLDIEERLPTAFPIYHDDVTRGEAIVLSYGGSHGHDRSFLVMASSKLANAIKAHHANDILSATLTKSQSDENDLVLSVSDPEETMTIDPSQVRVSNDHLEIGMEESIAWNQVKIITGQDIICFVLTDRRVLTFSEN